MQQDRFARENTIIGIFNYCTRRCERCRFTERCTLYLSEQDYQQRHPDADWQEQVRDSFVETFRLLEQWCKREGIDFAELCREADEEATSGAAERAAEDVRGDPLQKLATAYMHGALNIMDAMATARSMRRWGAEVENALDTITWDASMLSAKVHRALHGRSEQVLFHQEDPVQNDWNGSAKVARIIADESRQAWRVVLREGEAPENSALLALVALLDQIDAAIADRFPHAMEFIRPGFDMPADTRVLPRSAEPA
jgi:hypothetical protein